MIPRTSAAPGGLLEFDFPLLLSRFRMGVTKNQWESGIMRQLTFLGAIEVAAVAMFAVASPAVSFAEIPKGDIIIRLETVASGLTAPVSVTHAGGGSGRLFVVEQSGQIRIVQGDSILRIDVDSPPQAPLAYAIPPDNPFVGEPGVDEIYAFGLRNPYKFSFDDGPGGDGDPGVRRHGPVPVGDPAGVGHHQERRAGHASHPTDPGTARTAPIEIDRHAVPRIGGQGHRGTLRRRRRAAPLRIRRLSPSR